MKIVNKARRKIKNDEKTKEKKNQTKQKKNENNNIIIN